jgi:hypothetical protein
MMDGANEVFPSPPDTYRSAEAIMTNLLHMSSQSSLYFYLLQFFVYFYAYALVPERATLVFRHTLGSRIFSARFRQAPRYLRLERVDSDRIGD